MTALPANSDRDARSAAPPGLALPAFISALLAFATFAVTLGGTYIYDDVIIIQLDQRIPRVQLWTQYFTKPYMPGSVDHLYRPLTSLSFAVEWNLHNDDHPWIFHLVNVLLHAGATAAVAVFAGRLFGRPAAWVAGLLFAVHPVHVEVVAGLVGRAESLCTLATFSGLALCLRRPMSVARVAGIFACFAAAVLSKEQGILFPFLAIALVWLQKPGSQPIARNVVERRRLTGLIALLLGGLVAYLVLRQSILSFAWDRSGLDEQLQPLIRSTGADRWLMPFVLAGRYLVLLVWPWHLSIDYGGRVIGSTVRYGEPYFYLGIIAAVAWLVAIVFAARKRSGSVVFCLVAFAVTYAMIGNFLVLIGTILGERLMYMPSAFLIAIAAAALMRWPTRIWVPLVLLAVVLSATRSFAYARLWNDPVELCRSNLATQPESTRAYELLYDAQMRRRDFSGALATARRYQQAFGELGPPLDMIGRAAIELGDLPTAAAMLAEAEKRMKPKDLETLRHEVEQLRIKQPH